MLVVEHRGPMMQSGEYISFRTTDEMIAWMMRQIMYPIEYRIYQVTDSTMITVREKDKVQTLFDLRERFKETT